MMLFIKEKKTKGGNIVGHVYHPFVSRNLRDYRYVVIRGLVTGIVDHLVVEHYVGGREWPEILAVVP